MIVARRFIAGKVVPIGLKSRQGRLNGQCDRLPACPRMTGKMPVPTKSSAVPPGLNSLFICPETGDKSPAYYHVFLRNTAVEIIAGSDERGTKLTAEIAEAAEGENRKRRSPRSPR
jgi:hypothetical protein